MKKNTAAMVFGIIFGLGIAGLGYFNIFLALIVSLAKKGDFISYFIYIYPALGVVSIVGAAFARKNIVVTRIMLLIPNVVHIAIIAYTSIIAALTANMLLFALYAFVAVLGIISLLFALTAKNKENYQSPTPSFTPPSQSAQM